MESKDLLYETRNQAAWITLNRPRLLNALSAEMLTSIRRSYEAAGDDRDVRAVVITGAGRGFCAGADIHVMDNASLESLASFWHGGATSQRRSGPMQILDRDRKLGQEFVDRIVEPRVVNLDAYRSA